MSPTAIYFIVTWCSLCTLTLAQTVIKLAPIIDSTVGQAGTDDIRAKVFAQETQLKADAGPQINLELMKQSNYDTLGELFVFNDGQVTDVTGILTVMKCASVKEDEVNVRNDFPSSVYMTVLDRGCPRPPIDVGIGVPFLRSPNDIVPMMVDIRSDTRLLYGWEDIVILYDESIDINMLDVIVSMMQNTGTYKRATVVTTFNVCLKSGCNDLSSTVLDLLTPFSIMEFPRDFLVVASPSTGRKIFAQAKKLSVLDCDRRWLFVTPGYDVGGDLLAIASDVPPESSVAIIYKEDPKVPESSCFASTEIDGCQMVELMTAFVKSTRQVVESGEYSTQRSKERAMTKRRIIDTMMNTLGEIKTCGGCFKYILKTTAYKRPDVTSPQTIDDYETVGEWRSFQGLRMFGPLYPLTTGNFRGRKIKIGIINEPPGAKIVLDPVSKKPSYGGMIVDFVSEMAKEMNFTYEFVVPPDNQSGRKVKGKWTGMIGQIVNKEVEFAAQLFYMTRERMEVVNFTVAVEESAYALLVKRPHQEHQYLFLAPFTYDTWTCVFVTLVIMGPVLYLVHRASVYYEFHGLVTHKGLFRFSNCVWYCYGAIVQQGGVHLPLALSGRVLVGFWWIFVIVTVTTYSGNLVAVLTFPKIRLPINTFADMISHKGYYKWGIFEGEALLENFRTADKGEMLEINKGLTIYTKSMETKILEEIYDEELIFIDSKFHLLELMGKHHNRTKTCSYSVGTSDVVVQPVSLAVPKNWPYLEKMNIEISRLVEGGIFIRWRKRASPPDNECTTSSKPQSGDIRKINLSQMMGSFFILGLGFLGGGISLFGEYMYLKFRDKGDAPSSFKNYLKYNFRLWGNKKAPVGPDTAKNKKFTDSKMMPDLKDPNRRKKKKKGPKHGGKALRGIENDGYTREYWDTGRSGDRGQYSDRENDIYSTFENYSSPSYKNNYGVKRDYDTFGRDNNRQSDDQWFSRRDQQNSGHQGDEIHERRRQNARDRRSYFSYDDDNHPRY